MGPSSSDRSATSRGANSASIPAKTSSRFASSKVRAPALAQPALAQADQNLRLEARGRQPALDAANQTPVDGDRGVSDRNIGGTLPSPRSLNFRALYGGTTVETTVSTPPKRLLRQQSQLTLGGTAASPEYGSLRAGLENSADFPIGTGVQALRVRSAAAALRSRTGSECAALGHRR
jgi:hypothetical protein